MSRISASLHAEHERIEAVLGEAVIAARSADWHVYRARFDALRIALLQHIAHEEDTLFPQLALLPGCDTVIAALRGEHRELRLGFDRLGAAKPPPDAEGWLAQLDQIAVLVREHHANELRICYPRLDRLETTSPD
jgi:iron-sulfur cluster repair protein YtfE (RIC family)